jgi:hypothetical protein
LRLRLQDRVDLVLALGALLDELSSSRDAAPQYAARLVAGPHLREKARGEKLDQRAGIDLVGLDLGAGDRPDRFGVGQHDPLHKGLEDADDRERVAGDLETDVVVWRQALGEHLKMFDVCWDARVAADLAVF